MPLVAVLLQDDYFGDRNGILSPYYNLPTPLEVMRPSRALQTPVAVELHATDTFVRLLRDRSAELSSMNVDQPCGLWLHPLLHCNLVQRSEHVKYVLSGRPPLGQEIILLKSLRATITVLQAELGAVKSVQRYAGYDTNDPSARDVDMLDRLVTQIEQKYEQCRAIFDLAMQERNMENAELSIKESKSAITRE